MVSVINKSNSTNNEFIDNDSSVRHEMSIIFIFILISLVAVFPRGIGFLYQSVAIDFNKMFYALAVFAVLASSLKLPNRLYDKIFYLFLVIPFFMFYFHLNPIRTFFGQFYNIFFYYSAYLIGRYVFNTESSVYNFAKIISILSLLFITILFYDWVSGNDYVNELRAYDDTVILLNVTSGRGQGIIDFMGGLAFKGWAVGQNRYSILAVAILFYVSFVFFVKKKSNFDVILFIATIGILFATVIMTHSRTGLVLLAFWIIVSTLYLLLSADYKKNMIFVGVLIIAILASYIIFKEYVNFLINSVSSLQVYIQDLFTTGPVKSIRADALQKIFAYIANNPLSILTGVNVHVYSLGLVDGVSFRRTVDLPYILTVFLEYGVLGVMFNMVIFFVAIKVCVLSFKNKDAYIALPMALMGLILHMTADNVLQLYWFIYLMFGGMVSYIYMNDAKK